MLSEEHLCQELLSEIGEKVVILRHDVDNIYGIYRPRRGAKVVKALNYGLLALLSLAPRLRYAIPYYEEHVEEIIDLEKAYGARATYFFRVVTLPKPRLLNTLKALGHEVAYHSDRNRSFHEWFEDLKYVEKELRVLKVKGFTKHGHSIIRDGGPWNEDKFVEYAAKAKLKYLAQGEGHMEWELPRRIRGVWVFGHHVTLKKVSLKHAIRYIETRCLPMVLAHPEDVLIPGEKEKLEHILSRRRGISVITAINSIEKLLNELRFSSRGG